VTFIGRFVKLLLNAPANASTKVVYLYGSAALQQATAVPEPSTVSMLIPVLAILAFTALRRRRFDRRLVFDKQ
jgi:hypothetical protein